MVTYEEMNMLAAYGGFPTRYPHWRFGMEYLEMQKSYEYGLSKIYEMVINTDPSYAYLLDNNLLVDQKLVMAHVYGHVDFFKNNLWFDAHEPQDARSDGQPRGQGAPDHGPPRSRPRSSSSSIMVLSIDNLIDPVPVRTSSSTRIHHRGRHRAGRVGRPRRRVCPPRATWTPTSTRPSSSRRSDASKQEELDRMRSFPEAPVRDVLGFIMQHAQLPRWKQELMGIIRDEAYYFGASGTDKDHERGVGHLLAHPA